MGSLWRTALGQWAGAGAGTSPVSVKRWYCTGMNFGGLAGPQQEGRQRISASKLGSKKKAEDRRGHLRQWGTRDERTLLPPHPAHRHRVYDPGTHFALHAASCPRATWVQAQSQAQRAQAAAKGTPADVDHPVQCGAHGAVAPALQHVPGVQNEVACGGGHGAHGAQSRRGSAPPAHVEAHEPSGARQGGGTAWMGSVGRHPLPGTLHHAMAPGANDVNGSG